MKNIMIQAAAALGIAVLVLVAASNSSVHGAIGTERASVTALLSAAR